VPRGLLPRFRRGQASRFRHRESIAALTLALTFGFEGCIEPQDAYEAFVDRAPAPDAAAPTTSDAGEPCSEILAAAPSGTFYGACLTRATAGAAADATYVKLDSTIVPAAGNATGTITVAMTSLALSPTNLAQTVGDTSNPPPAAIAADCTYVIEAGTITIPAPASYAGVALVLAGTRYRGKLLTPDSSCADLDATVTSPVSTDLTQGGNYCVFRRAPADGSITLFTAAEFACPGAPAM
jgi:hypothetical protein